MTAYHNAVSDQLIISVFSDAIIYQVFSKDSLLKWSSLTHVGASFPAELSGAIFSTSKLLFANLKFTLAPLESNSPENYFTLNHSNGAALEVFAGEEFKLICESPILLQGFYDNIVSAQKEYDITLFYNYLSAKAYKNVLFYTLSEKQLTILVWKDGVFQLANRYSAENMDELFYFVMLVVEQLDLVSDSLHFECLLPKEEHQEHFALFKNYLPPLHLTASPQCQEVENRELWNTAHFLSQCVL